MLRFWVGGYTPSSAIPCNFDNEFACDKPHYENEAPFEVPSSWEWCKLGEVCVFLSRGKSPKYLDEDRQYPVFAQKCNLKEGGISLAQARFLDPMTINKWDEVYKLRTGDVLVNSTGTGTVGRTRLFNESCLGDYPFVVPDSHVSVVRTADEIVSEYIYAYMSSNVVQEYLEENLAGSTNQKELYIGILDSLQIPLPPYVEQKRIVSEIEKWYKASEAIENGKSDLEKVIRQTKNKILELAIHGKLVPQDPNDEPASELLKRINPKAEITCDNPQYGKLPDGWCFVSVGNYVKLVTDFVASGSFASLRENVKYYNSPEYAILVRTKDFQNNFQNELVYTDKHGYDFLEKSNLHGGELVFSNVGSIGKVFIVPHLKQKMTLAPNAIMVRFHHDEHQKWFYYLFQSSTGLNLLHSITSATAIGKFNKTDFKKLVIPIPPLSEQHRIVEKIEELFAQLDKIEVSL